MSSTAFNLKIGHNRMQILHMLTIWLVKKDVQAG